MAKLEDQVAVVTGATGNLGQATVRALLTAGARVVAVDRSAERATATYEEHGALPACLQIEAADATDAESVEAVMRRVHQRLGRIDVLVNTVGAFRGGKPLHEEAPDLWEFLFKINVATAVLSCRSAVPFMLQQRRGCIVNVASRDALAGKAGVAAYSASKAALLRMTESLAREVEGSGVNVNAVLPGTIDTPQNRKAMPDSKFDTWVTPTAVAEVIVFLASDQARAISGAAIPVFGKG